MGSSRNARSARCGKRVSQKSADEGGACQKRRPGPRRVFSSSALHAGQGAGTRAFGSKGSLSSFPPRLCRVSGQRKGNKRNGVFPPSCLELVWPQLCMLCVGDCVFVGV